MRLLRRTIPALACSARPITASPARVKVLWHGGTPAPPPRHCATLRQRRHPGIHDGRGQLCKLKEPSGRELCEAHDISAGGSCYARKNNSTYYLGCDTGTPPVRPARRVPGRRQLSMTACRSHFDSVTGWIASSTVVCSACLPTRISVKPCAGPPDDRSEA